MKSVDEEMLERKTLLEKPNVDILSNETNCTKDVNVKNDNVSLDEGYLIFSFFLFSHFCA